MTENDPKMETENEKAAEEPADAPQDASDSKTPETGAVAEDAQAEGAESQPKNDAPAGDSEAPDLASELAETNDRLLRALAEAENVRRRATRDVENASKRAIAGFAREMLTVADNLGRALEAVDTKLAEENEAMKNLLVGVEMTAREMQNTFERNGIKRLDPLGEAFDPQLHEAMFEFEDVSKPAGTVGQVLESGYSLHGQPLRPAKVGVTKGGAKREAPPTPSEEVLKDAEQQNASGGSAYEDTGKPAGSQLDEEL